MQQATAETPVSRSSSRKIVFAKKSVKQRKRSKDLTVHCHRRKCTRRQQNYTGESVKSVWSEAQRERERERERGKEAEEDCEEKWGAEGGLYSKQEGKVRHGQYRGQLGGW
jgi:prophage tail gpP-like protein